MVLLLLLWFQKDRIEFELVVCISDLSGDSAMYEHAERNVVVN